MCPLFHGNNLFFRLLSSEVRNSEFQGSFRFLSFFLCLCLYLPVCMSSLLLAVNDYILAIVVFEPADEYTLAPSLPC